jgi:hypothetical protein
MTELEHVASRVIPHVNWKYPWRTLGVDESFTVQPSPDKHIKVQLGNVRTAAYAAGLRLGRRFLCTRVLDEIIVTRVQ